MTKKTSTRLIILGSCVWGCALGLAFADVLPCVTIPVGIVGAIFTAVMVVRQA